MADRVSRGTERGDPFPAEGGQERIRVLQFVTSFFLGGTERQVVNLARALDPRFDVHFGSLYRNGELLGEVAERAIPVTEYPISKLYDARAWRERLRFIRYLKRERIHLVHTYNFSANLFAVPAAWLAGIPVVASIRGTGTDLTPLQQRAQRLVCRLARLIAVNADAVRQWLVHGGYDPDKIVVIRNGVDLSRFSGRSGDGRVHRELGLPPGVPLVAALCRLIRLKGLEHFLEAAALVARDVPDARFLVVGDRLMVGKGGTIVRDIEYRRELEAYANTLGLSDRVVFTGFRLDIPELLAEVAVSVLPSVEAEGLSNVLLESMAVGVPVVATRVGGAAEAVVNGVTGLLVPPRDTPALARAIGHLLVQRDVAARFGAAGRERVATHFTMERCTRDTERLYVDLLQEPGRFSSMPAGAVAPTNTSSR